MSDQMRIPSGKRVLLTLLGLGVTFITAFVGPTSPAAAAEYDLYSTTYLSLYDRDQAVGEDQQFISLYEYLSLDLWELSGPEWSFHLYGWGRKDLGDDTDDDGAGGSLSSAYAQYSHPEGKRYQLKAGRFYLTEGTASETLDGIFTRGRHTSGLGGAVFGGRPVENSVSSDEEGDLLAGGRISYVLEGFAELGLGYLTEEGDFNGDDRREVGGDLWLRPAEGIEIVGRGLYNLATSGMASYRLAARFGPLPSLDLLVGGEGYRYGDLFQSSLNSAFGFSILDPDDEVTAVFADLDWRFNGRSALRAGIRNIRHDRSDPGDANRGELGVRFTLEGFLDGLGLSAAVQTADLPENEYSQVRGYALKSMGNWTFSLDALTQSYEEEISGEDTVLQVVGSAGRRFSGDLKLSGDIRYTESPNFEEDLAVLVRAEVGL